MQNLNRYYILDFKIGAWFVRTSDTVDNYCGVMYRNQLCYIYVSQCCGVIPLCKI